MMKTVLETQRLISREMEDADFGALKDFLKEALKLLRIALICLLLSLLALLVK